MRRYVFSLLKLYLDFIIVYTFVGLVSFFLGQAWNYAAGMGMPWFVEVLFSIGLVGLARVLGLSAGQWLLAPARRMADCEPRPRLWPNLVLGTFLILEGLKQMVRWTALDGVMPVFGLVETTPLKAALLLAMGALYVVAGAMILRFSLRAKLTTLVALAISTASIIASWPVLNEAIALAQTARRAAQGMPLREGEIETMQAMFPWITVGGLALILVLLWFSRERERAAWQ